MSWKRWKIGLAVAATTGLLTGVLGLAVNMTWKQIGMLIAITVAKDLLLFLKDHPPEEALVDGEGIAKSR
jgi:hypothetical protein